MAAGNATTPKITKGTASFIGKRAISEEDSKRKKKKDAKKIGDGIVRRLAIFWCKNGLIDKGKVKAAAEPSSTKKKKI